MPGPKIAVAFLFLGCYQSYHMPVMKIPLFAPVDF